MIWNGIELDKKARNELDAYESNFKIFNKSLKDIAENGSNRPDIALKQEYDDLKQSLESLGEKLFSKLKRD